MRGPEEDLLITDICDIVDRINRQEKFDDVDFEMWMARTYTKAYAVDAVSVSLLQGAPQSGYGTRMRLLTIAKQLGIDPLDYLPQPPRRWREKGVWFLVKNSYLAMGTDRAIDRCWEQMYRGTGRSRRRAV